MKINRSILGDKVVVDYIDKRARELGITRNKCIELLLRKWLRKKND